MTDFEGLDRYPALLRSFIAAPWTDPMRSFGLADVWSGCAVMFALDLAWSTARRPVRAPPQDRIDPLFLEAALVKSLLGSVGFALVWLPSTRATALLCLDVALAGAALLTTQRSKLFTD